MKNNRNSNRPQRNYQGFHGMAWRGGGFGFFGLRDC
jgi:hypothetical protein